MSVELTRLPSGLVIITDAMPHLETASLGVWIGSGSRDEAPEEHGISHFLEHMAFKGTKRRTARDIAEQIEAVGGDLNAATGVETTAYYARVLKADVPLALDVLSDILSEPTFDPDDLTREKNVILQEIGASEDTPDDIIFEHLQATAYPDQPVGRTIMGTRDTVRSLDRKQLRSYLGRHYRSPDMVISAAGSVTHEQIVDEAVRLFKSFEGEAAPVPSGAKFVGGTRIEKRDLEQVHVALGFEGVKQGDPAIHSLQVFANVLGGGMSSRLFQEVRELRGLCYSVYSFHAPYHDTGLFAIYAGTDPNDVDELMRVCADEIEKAGETITEAEIARAKAQMKAGLLMALESSGARAEQLARQMMIYGRPLPLEEVVAKIEGVTVESVRAAGTALLSRGKPVVAVLGPGTRLESAAAIAEGLTRRLM
ncbi:MAG TPA: pitrilysin family protein [Xanthobacteraceae bacterium]|nr:pitrilysin family protein [Xanthobacteraceae bacterium]